MDFMRALRYGEGMPPLQLVDDGGWWPVDAFRQVDALRAYGDADIVELAQHLSDRVEVHQSRWVRARTKRHVGF
jgi:hypothetical protein